MNPDADFIETLTFMRDKAIGLQKQYDATAFSAIIAEFYRGKAQAFTQVLKTIEHRDDARRGKKCTR